MLLFPLCSCQRPASFALACPRSQERGNRAPTSGRWAGRDGPGRARVPGRQQFRVGSAGICWAGEGMDFSRVTPNRPLVLSLSKDAPGRTTEAANWIIPSPRSGRLGDAALRACPQDEVAGCGSNLKGRLGLVSRRDLPQVLENARFCGRKWKEMEEFGRAGGRDWKQKGQDWKGLEDNGNRRMRFLFGPRVSSCAPCQRNGNGAATP